LNSHRRALERSAFIGLDPVQTAVAGDEAADAAALAGWQAGWTVADVGLMIVHCSMAPRPINFNAILNRIESA
jgi:hypothetical protein